MLRTRLPSVVLSAAAAGSVLFGTALADEVFRPTAAVSLPNGQKISSFDISYVDPVIGLYILGDRTNKAVDVVDTGTNTVLAQLGAGAFAGFTGNNDTSGPDGVLIVNHREVWAGDGNSTIKVIDLFSQQITHTINTGGAFRADELCYDPRDRIVLMANDAEHDNPAKYPYVSFIDTQTYAVLGRITMDGTNGTPRATNGIEQCQWSRRTGKIYLNIPEVNGPGNDTAPGAVVVISPQEMKIERIFSVPHDKCAGPQGMAIGPDHQILLGCNAPSGVTATNPAGNGHYSTIIIDERDGSVIQTLDNESGADEVWYNDGDGHYFLARSATPAPQPSQLGVVDAEPPREDASVPTGTNGVKAHSVAADPVLNQVYVPIPANAGANVCSTAGGSDAQGCIAVFTAPHDDSHQAYNR
ncbi:MAG: hypothetical protein JO267_12430 [Alphaproteobacteria bacterium]|nr:hypothetical protein [Alphaproteobacteria bacterium]